MYNRRYNKCCSCRKCNNNANLNMCEDDLEETFEDSCDDVANLSDYFSKEDSCECGYDQGMPVFPNNAVLAQSYVPFQYMDRTFKPCVGLKMGTIFPELVSPYMPCQSMEEIEFIKAANKIGKGCNR